MITSHPDFASVSTIVVMVDVVSCMPSCLIPGCYLGDQQNAVDNVYLKIERVEGTDAK